MRPFAFALPLPLALTASLALGGCFLFPNNDTADATPVVPQDPSLHAAGPIGPVASDANEAWPDRPAQPPALTATEIAEGCMAWAACQAEGSGVLDATQDCVSEVESMTERAIPLSFGDISAEQGGAGIEDERAELFVRCAAQHTGDCTSLAGCLTDRTVSFNCQEDGCAADTAYTISCAGTVATMTDTLGKVDHRDCARAFTTCDPSSETGCTDRLFTQCDPTKTKADRCDGDIRLGCDGAGQVSYHDCARLGGTCGVLANGADGCVYPTDAECTAGDHLTCDGPMLDACIEGRHVTIAAPVACAP